MLIGICGNVGCRKDEVIKLIKDELGAYVVTISSFVDKAAYNIFGIYPNDTNYNARKIKNDVYEYMKRIIPTVWIGAIVREYVNYYEPLKDNMIIADIDRLVDAKHLIENGGVVLFIHMSESDRRKNVEKEAGKLTDEEWEKLNSSYIKVIEMLEGVKHVYITPNDDKDILRGKVFPRLSKTILK